MNAMKTVKICSVSIPLLTYSWYRANTQRGETRSLFPVVSAHGRSYTLQQVQVIFRHGARTPILAASQEQFRTLREVVWDEEELMRTLPGTELEYELKSLDGGAASASGNAKKVALPGGCLTGQLTVLGQQQTFELGKWLADAYIGKHSLVSPRYDPNVVYIRSTNVPRTIHSALCVTAGLYGKENVAEPLSIHTNELKTDDMLPNFRGDCPRLFERFRRYWFRPPETLVAAESEVNASVGIQDGVTPLNFIEISDIVLCREAHDLFVPTQLIEQYDSIYKNSLILQLSILGLDSVEGVRNCVGSFLETLCSRITEAAAGKCEHRMSLYATHDTTLMALLEVLRSYDGKHWPEFASYVILELHERDDGEKYIRVLYDGTALVLDGHSDGDEEYLPLAEFLTLVEPYRVLDWAGECSF